MVLLQNLLFKVQFVDYCIKMNAMRVTVLILLCFVSLKSNGQTKDSLSVIETTEKYIQAFYQKKPKWLKDVLHPELIKRTIKSYQDSNEFIKTSGKSEMVELSKVFNANGKFNSNSRANIEVLDLYKKIATVKLTAEKWIDYLHLIKVNQKWQIIDVIWIMI